MIQSHGYHPHRRRPHSERWELDPRRSSLHVLPQLPACRPPQTHSCHHFASADPLDCGWCAPEWRLGWWRTCFAIDVRWGPYPAMKERRHPTWLLEVQCSMNRAGAYDGTYCVNFQVGGCCPSATSTILPGCCVVRAVPGAFLACLDQSKPLIHLSATMFVK